MRPAYPGGNPPCYRRAGRVTRLSARPLPRQIKPADASNAIGKPVCGSSEEEEEARPERAPFRTCTLDAGEAPDPLGEPEELRPAPEEEPEDAPP